MIQITAPHFCAGLIHHNGRVVNAAPILRYMINCGSRLPLATFDQRRNAS